MKSVSKTVALLGGMALVVGVSSAAGAQSAQKSQPVPKNWKYEIKDGKRVPKVPRVTNADGSWREEVRQGNCITVREKTAAGEYKESRRCE